MNGREIIPLLFPVRFPALCIYECPEEDSMRIAGSPWLLCQSKYLVGNLSNNFIENREYAFQEQLSVRSQFIGSMKADYLSLEISKYQSNVWASGLQSTGPLASVNISY